MKLLIIACLLALASADDSCGGSVDIIFVLDSSGSVHNDDFDLMVDFVYNVVSGLEINDGSESGPGARVGLLVYDYYMELQFHLNAYTDKIALLDAIDERKTTINTGDTTNTGVAIRYARTVMFTADNGTRQGASKVMVVMTDGVSNSGSETQDEALLAQQENIIMIAVGIGPNVNFDEIDIIASDPDEDHAITPTGFDQLQSLVGSLSQALCPPEPCVGSVDIIFVLDSSGSVGNYNFDLMVDFVYNVVSGLEINDGSESGPGARVGLLVYDSYMELQFHLNNYTDKTALLDAIDLRKTTIYSGGSTNTAGAIGYARTVMFNAENGTRQGVSQVMVVMTDGVSNSESETQAEALLAQQDNILMIAVGIGSGVNFAEIDIIASDPDEQHAITPTGFGELQSLVGNLSQAFCPEVEEEEEEECPFIDPSSETCCCGTIQAGNDTYCCGGSGMDPATEICCGNAVFQVGYAYDYTCCGDSAMSISSDLCCDGVIQAAANNQMGYYTDMACCGQQTFDPKTQVCCEGNIEQGDSCCDADGFDSATHHCCSGQVVPWGEHYDCCGTVPYDQENEACCGNGVVVPKVQNRNCSGVSYRKWEEMCCCGVLNSGREVTWECCGTVSYQMGKDLCCEGNVLISGFSGVTHDCCGVQPYKPTQESCCDGQVVQGAKISGVTACCGADLYDIGDQLCCAENVQAKHSTYVTRCCGTGVFYPEFEVCCEGVVHSGTSLMCCGSEAYDPAVESCCSDGSILPSH